MKKALIYCRVSTEEQAQDGHHSLSAQKSICIKTAEDLGYKIVEIYIDPGKSATNMNRLGLQDMLIRCQEDKSINAVFIQDTDRLARNTKDHLTIKAILQKEDVKVISASQPTIDETAEGNMIDTIIASVNQFGSEIIGRKTLKGLEEKVRNGGWPRPAPLGYINDTDKEGNKIITIDEFTAPLIKEAFQLYSKGNYSAQSVAEILGEKGFRTKSGKKIQNSKMIYLLKNRFYIGEIKWNKIESKGNHKALIDKKTFDTVQEVLASHNHHSSRSRKYTYLLSGFLYCGVCGSRFTGETHSDKNVSYYRCTKRINHKEKFSKTDDLEQQVEERFEDLQFSDEFINLVVDKVKGLFKQKEKVVDGQKQILINQKQGVEKKRNVAEEKLFSGVISDEDFQRIKVGFTGQLDTIQNQIDELNRIREIKVDEIQEVLKLTRNIAKAYREASDRRKRHYLAMFWEKFEIMDTKIINAIPKKLFSALQKDLVVSYNANINPLKIKSLLSTKELVKIRGFWGA